MARQRQLGGVPAAVRTTLGLAECLKKKRGVKKKLPLQLQVDTCQTHKASVLTGGIPVCQELDALCFRIVDQTLWQNTTILQVDLVDLWSDSALSQGNGLQDLELLLRKLGDTQTLDLSLLAQLG